MGMISALKALLILALPAIMVPSIGANPLEWHWTSDEADVSYYRYKFVEEEDWTMVGSETTSYRLDNPEPGREYTLMLESSFDGLHWSSPASRTLQTPVVVPDSAEVEIDATTRPIVDEDMVVSESISAATSQDGTVQARPLADDSMLEIPAAEEDDMPVPASGGSIIAGMRLSPLAFGIYDFYNGHGIEDARYLSYTYPGMMIGADIGYRFGNGISLSAGYGFAFLSKRETVLPDGERIYHHAIDAGIGYMAMAWGHVEFRGRLSAGLMISQNAGSHSIAPLAGVRVGMGYAFDEGLSIGLEGGCIFSYQHSSERLYRSMSYIAEGVSAYMEFRI